MTGFNLPQNFHSDILRRTRARLISLQRPLSVAEPVIASSLASQAMAQKTLYYFSTPSANQVPTRPEVNTRGENFEIKTGLITMLQAIPFCGKANEDASAHLQQFLELCSTFVIKGVSQDAIRLRMFPFSLLGERSNGFMLTRLLWTPGTNVPRRSSRSSSRRVKPMLCMDGFRTFSMHQMSQFLNLRRDFRRTF